MPQLEEAVNLRFVAVPITAAAVTVAALTTIATPSSARPATSCATLAQRMQKAYDVYENDVHKYGSKDRRTEDAYDAYQKAKQAYSKCL